MQISTYLIDLVRMLSQRTHMYAWYRHISSSDIPPSELAGLLLFLNKIEYFFQAAIHYQNWHKLKSLLTAACGVSSVIKQHKCRCKQMVLVLTFGSPSWTRTNDPAVNSRMLYQLSYWGMFQSPIKIGDFYVGTDLFFQAVARQVSSARMSLTTVFGMGTGGPSS